MGKNKYPDLFTAYADGQMNACLNFQNDMSYGYIEGYLQAADRLVEHVAERNRDQDTLVYPIAFMYRHHIELRLKEIIDIGKQLITDNESGHPTNHKLRDLWPDAKGIIRQVWSGNPDPEEFKRIDHFILQFTEVDHDSTAFRYPKQKSGDSSLCGVRHINLRNLAECVHSFSGFLTGVATALSEYLDDKREQQAQSGYW
jgi:hypothetical protein